MDQTLQFDRQLLRKYDVSGPRYTSYPTALQFDESFDAQAYRRAVADSNEDPLPRGLSLYVHIPFCRTVCFYCGCNKVITANYRRAEDYLDRLKREIALQAPLFDRDRRVEQMHFGGGTPTYLNEDDLVGLIGALSESFPMDTSARREFSIEIDPRTVSPEKIRMLSELGFNRMSLGVQDFDPEVQAAVNRIQSVEQTETVIAAARANGYSSTNLDLIYGLPKQTPETFSRTLDTVLRLRPERLAVYNYAHMPHLFKVQRRIRPEDLPDAETKLAILEMTIQRLTSAGYVYIGMDHFALPDDELARAQRKGGLHRNFQGYSTRAQLDLIGLGMSSIGRIGDSYSQNRKDLASYGEALDRGELPVFRGYSLTGDDRLRADVIGQIMCQSELDYRRIEARYRIVFRQYFHDELVRLQPLADDGLVRFQRDGLSVTPRGRLFLRNIGMVFDAYLHQPKGGVRPRFSRVL
ncbi:MAG: oxygen-independent coproporphyrinogen III oxidase [Ectothiorhodospiraceae bacterium]|jgi:oxygen-independent coproporphyrinogen-3 oxidase